MSDIEAYTPSKTAANAMQLRRVPEQMITTVNGLLTKYYNGKTGSCVISQDEIINCFLGRYNSQIAIQRGEGFSAEEVIDNHWLDFEEIYEEAGWKVKFCNAGYNSSNEACFRFSDKERFNER